MARAAIDDRLSNTSAPRTRFVVATRDDDAAIRRLLRDNPMPGAISLSLEREPAYFLGANIGYADDQTILAFESERLVCMGRCTFRTCWVNGHPRRIGYLGELRLDASAQGRFDLLRRGYRYFHKLHQTTPTECYFTSIAADNDRARRLFESGHRGLPSYEFLGGFITILIAVPQRKRMGKFRIENGSPERAADMVAMLNHHAQTHQLAAVWTEENLRSLADHALSLDHFQLAMEGERILACGALWDQRAFRQTVIRGYARGLSAARPLINLGAQFLGTTRLPPMGTTLRHAFISPIAFEAGYESLLPDFVETFFTMATRRGIEFLTLGLPAHDARLPALRRRFSTRSYHSGLYRVSWKGDISSPFSPEMALFFPEVALM